MQWERLNIKLSTASSSALEALVHPGSGIARNVRELEFVEPINSAEVEDRLRMLIAAIPPDRLRDLTCYRPFSTLALQTVLQSQRKLEALEVFTDLTTPGRAGLSDLVPKEHYSRMTSSLPDINAISLYILPNGVPEELIFEGIKSISDNHSKIDDLALTSISNSRDEGTSLCGILRHAKQLPLFSNLSTLALMDLKLGNIGGKSTWKSLDFSRLSYLQIDESNYIVPFVEALSSYYTIGVGELADLHIILPYRLEEPRNSVRAIEELLKVCPKLKSLQLELSRHGPVAKDCILAHQQRLRWLMMGTGESEIHSYLSVTDMTAILRACVHLKQLAINMPATNLGLITKLGTSFYPEGEFADMLVSIRPHHASLIR